MCSKAAVNVGTLPRLASPLFIQLPKPFAHHDGDDDLEHDGRILRLNAVC